MKRYLASILLALLLSCCYAQDEPIKIMPVGDSITAGEHYGHPALNERCGYRKELYQKLTNAGKNVDFVGTQSHGMRSPNDKDWYDWNNEAYPGWKIPDIARMLKISLEINQPDILILHVGTNGGDWDQKPDQVMEMLDMIDQHSAANAQPLTVFLCKIINRFAEEDQTPTSEFNRAVETLLRARTNDRIDIILVDLEAGAGLDYTDQLPDPKGNPPYEGGDMLGKRYPGVPYDKYHPNEKGHAKIAQKLFEAIVEKL